MNLIILNATGLSGDVFYLLLGIGRYIFFFSLINFSYCQYKPDKSDSVL